MTNATDMIARHLDADADRIVTTTQAVAADVLTLDGGLAMVRRWAAREVTAAAGGAPLDDTAAQALSMLERGDDAIAFVDDLLDAEDDARAGFDRDLAKLVRVAVEVGEGRKSASGIAGKAHNFALDVDKFRTAHRGRKSNPAGVTRRLFDLAIAPVWA